ncbi:TPA: malto-oligosyltrehalose trehalohydrolase [Pseudomonas aeruginosa]|nr:malto-oligosyltrehalose trehalohydrolase [Pseudomonas aeruginosa]
MAIRRRFGAQFQGNGRTCFGLWAPDAREVRVETADGRDWPLEGSDSGWFEATLPCPPGTRYRYRIDGRPGVPDPASQFQPDGVHGHSQVLDHGAYAWRVDEWHGRPWHEAVIYELHVGLFGSYAEVERFLPRLVELGVTAVELMPLGEFPGRRNWGYDGVLPFAPASAYGTPEQLKHLIDSAHGMGLMVFVDVIYNHFGPDGNYLAQYAAAFFRDDRQTPWGQAIDFRRGEVREFFYENALMWLLDYRVDGLRLDAVHAIPDSAFLLEMARRLRGAAGPERHVHLVLENDDNRASLLRQGYDAQWNDDGHHALHVLLTGENDGYYQDYPEPLRCLARCLAEGFVYQGEANRHGRPRGEPSADLAPDAFVLFLQNHDQVGNRAFGERLSVLAEPQTLRLAIALQLLAPMIPLLFMGEECAAREPFLYFTDHQGELADAVREGRRKEFGEFGRFGEGAILASLPDPNAVETFERSRPGLADCDPAWRGFYRQLLEIRHEHLIPRLRGARSLGVTTIAGAALSARWRLGDGSDWRIDFNPSPLEAEVEPPTAATRVLFLDNLACAEYRRGRLSPRSIAVSLEPAHE